MARICSKATAIELELAAPVARARHSRVKSSAVGPSPPVATTTSARAMAWRNASAPGSNSSPTVEWHSTRMPNSSSRWLSHCEFVSSS